MSTLKHNIRPAVVPGRACGHVGACTAPADKAQDFGGRRVGGHARPLGPAEGSCYRLLCETRSWGRTGYTHPTLTTKICVHDCLYLLRSWYISLSIDIYIY